MEKLVVSIIGLIGLLIISQPTHQLWSSCGASFTLLEPCKNCNQNIIPEPIKVKENELEHFTFKDKFKYNFDSYYLTKTLLNSIDLILIRKTFEIMVFLM